MSVNVGVGVRVKVGVIVGVSLGVDVGVNVTIGRGIGLVKSTSSKFALTHPPANFLISGSGCPLATNSQVSSFIFTWTALKSRQVSTGICPNTGYRSLLGPSRTLMFRASILLTHSSTDRKGGLVEVGVKVGCVGVRVCVTVMVGDGVCVAVGGSGVEVAIGDGVSETKGVWAAVGVSSVGGLVRGIRKKANKMSTRRAGIPKLRNHGGSERIVF